jgi:hypothetical protein
MRKLMNYWLPAAGALALVAGLAMLSPRRSEAQYSSPVKVLNTSAAPAIASLIDDPGRVAFQSQGVVQSPGLGGTSVVLAFGTVPPNKRLVVQHLTGNFFASGSGPAFIPLGTSSATLSTFLSQIFTGGVSAFDQPVLAYFDAGSTPLVAASGGPTYTSASAYLSGYMLDCSAAPCSAIAH